MRSRFRSQQGPHDSREGGNLELVRVRGTQRGTGDARGELRGRSRRRGGRGRPRGRRPAAPAENRGFFAWLGRLLGWSKERSKPTRVQQETRALEDFQKHFQLSFADPELLKLALTHRSYLSVTGQGPRESNERLEFLGDSVLGLVTSEFLYRENPTEHEGDLTKTKSLLVSKAILSRRALAMGLGRFVLMSHSEVESGGRQRLSILADAFEAVLGAIYLDQGFEPARAFIHKWLLRESEEIVADKRHTNYKSHLQEYVQSTWRTHPVYRIRSEMGPDHSKHFLVEVLVGKRGLGEGRGRNKKEAEQAAARNALERAGVDVGNDEVGTELDEVVTPAPRGRRDRRTVETEPAEPREAREPRETREDDDAEEDARGRRRGRRGGRGRERTREREPERPAVRVTEDDEAPVASVPSRLATPSHRMKPLPEPPAPRPYEPEKEPMPSPIEEDELDDVGRPEGPLEELHVDPYSWSESAEEEPIVDEPAIETPVFEEPDFEDPVVEEPVAVEAEFVPPVERPGPPRVVEAVAEFREPEAEVSRPEPPKPVAPPAPAFGRRRSRRG